jgi:large subunit ribosomal protein L17
MRHLVAGKKLNRSTSHRISLLRNMSLSLIQHEQIVTTLPKAVFLRSFLEKLITTGKKFISSECQHRKLYLRRLIISKLGGAKSAEMAEKVISVLALRYKDRPGGYLRIIKYKNRSDATQTAVIQFVDKA